MTYYKAFSKGMICRGKQYQENTVYEEQGSDKCCEAGMMHFCKEPFDVLDYYPLVDDNGDIAEFAEVEPLDEVKTDGNICASKKIRIGAKFGLKGFIEAAVSVIIEKTKGKNESGNCAKIGSSGYCAQIGSSGYGAQIGSSGYGAQIGSSGYGAKIGSSGYCAKIGSSGYGAQIGSSGYGAKIGSSGYCAKIGSSGYGAQIGSSGYGAKIGSSGNCAQIGSSGYGAKIGSSGYCAKIGSSGDGAKIGSSGDCAQIGSSGDGAKINMQGDRSVAASVGNNGRAKGKLGCWIVLAEWEVIDDKYTPVCVKAGKIDGDTLKPDTWYKLESGEFVEDAE